MPSTPAHAQIDALYCDHHDWLHNWLRRRLGNAADAADLSHDAFLRLLLAPRGFAGPPEARSYLRAMANGLCVDLWRRREIEQAWLDVLASQPESFAASSEHHCIVLQALQDIDTLLRGLPAKASRAFVLAVGCGMTDKEVAAEIGVSTRMIRKYVAQAMLLCMELEERQGHHAALGSRA